MYVDYFSWRGLYVILNLGINFRLFILMIKVPTLVRSKNFSRHLHWMMLMCMLLDAQTTSAIVKMDTLAAHLKSIMDLGVVKASDLFVVMMSYIAVQ